MKKRILERIIFVLLILNFSLSLYSKDRGTLLSEVYEFIDNKQYDQALELLKSYEDKSDSEIQFQLGYCYEEVDEAIRDYELAYEWYVKAARQGHAVALNNLAVLYVDNKVKGVDETNISNLYKEAADKGVIVAQYETGLNYYSGRYVEQNFENAFYYFSLAASQNHIGSQFYLGRMYELGRGVEKNIEKSIEYYTNAGNNGHDIACNNLAVKYYDGVEVEQNNETALFWFKKAAFLGNGYSAMKAGELLLYGNNVQHDEKEAVEYLNLSVELGETRANYYLGLCAEQGRGLQKSLDAAFDYYIAGAKAGNENCINKIKNHEKLAEFVNGKCLKVIEEGQKGNFEAVLVDGKKWSDITVYGLGSDIVNDGYYVYSWLMAAYDRAGDVENALFYAKKEFEIAEAVFGADTIQTAIAYKTLAQVYFNKVDYDNVIVCCEKLLGISFSKDLSLEENKNFYSLLIDCYRLLGEAYLGKENTKTAKYYFEKALENEMQFSEESKLLALIYDGLSRVYAETDIYKALEYEQKNLAILKKYDDLMNIAASYNNIGMFYYNCQNYELSIQYLTQAIECTENLFGKRHPKTVTSYSNLGLAYFKNNQLELALENCLTAMQIFENNKLQFLNDNTKEASCFSNLSLIYSKMGDNKLSEVYIKKALEIYSNQTVKNGNSYAIALYSYAAQLFALGKKEESINLTLEALSILPGNSRDYVQCCSNLCTQYNDIGKYDIALEYGNKALDICRQLKLEECDPLYLTVYNNLAYVYKALEDYEKTIEILKKVYKLNSEQKGETDASNLLYVANIIIEYLSVNNYEPLKAISYYETFLECAQNSNDYNTILSHCIILDVLLNYIVQKGNRETFTVPENYDFCIDVLNKGIETGINAIERARINLTSNKTDVSQKAYPLYINAIDFYTWQKQYDKAFQIYEMSRNREFLDEIGEELAYSAANIPAEQKNQINELEKKIQEERKILANLKTDAEENTQHSKNLFEAERELQVIQKNISDKSPKYTQLKNPRIVLLEEAKEYCTDKKAILEFLLCKKEDFLLNSDVNQDYVKDTLVSSYCLVITKEKTYSVSLENTDEIEMQINKLRNILTSGEDVNTKDFTDLQKQLYSELFQSAVEQLPPSIAELIIVPDSNLSSLPFDVLMDENNVLLGDKYLLSVSPSVSVSLLAKNNNLPEVQRKILAIGNAVYSLQEDSVNRGIIRKKMAKQQVVTVTDPKLAGEYFSQQGIHWSNIPGTGIEINRLKSEIFSNDKITVVEGNTASEAKLKELSDSEKLKDYSIIHLACHGYFDSENPQMSSIVFSEVSKEGKTNDDGYLTLSEAALLNLNAEFLNLSACQTGLSQVKKGDGMTGLTRSFMVAGAENVGVTLWCVDDEATCEFMTRMYSYIQDENITLKEAYSKVKKEFRKSEKWNSPYYWAPFVLYE